MRKLILFSLLLLGSSADAQLSNGTTAPDFTLTDWYGNAHHLYSYLNDGKTVFVEIFAAHCPSCWAYHQTDILKNMYNNYGPDGTNEIMVLALEHDEYNGEMAFTGVGDPWNTAGNWLDGTPYPQFNVEGTDRSVFTDYNVTYYPVIYKICPDKKTEMVFASTQENELYAKVQDCQVAAIDKSNSELEIQFNTVDKQLHINPIGQVKSLHIVNMEGQSVHSTNAIQSNTINLSFLQMGIYLFNFETTSGIRSEKIVVY